MILALVLVGAGSYMLTTDNIVERKYGGIMSNAEKKFTGGFGVLFSAMAFRASVIQFSAKKEIEK